jgi:hypothetical protein
LAAGGLDFRSAPRVLGGVVSPKSRRGCARTHLETPLLWGSGEVAGCRSSSGGSNGGERAVLYSLLHEEEKRKLGMASGSPYRREKSGLARGAWCEQRPAPGGRIQVAEVTLAQQRGTEG